MTVNVTKSRLRRVEQLINADDHIWKEEVVKNVFLPHDAEAILRIRLPTNGDEDFLSWNPEKMGCSLFAVLITLHWT